MPATTLDHVNVVVTDMERSVRFYTRLLGLRPVMDRELSGEWFERVVGRPGIRARCVILAAPEGGLRVELLRFEDGTAGPGDLSPWTGGLRHFAVRVDDLEAALNILAQEFGQVVEAVQVPPDIVKGGKGMCYVRDPDGAIIELCRYGSERPEFR